MKQEQTNLLKWVYVTTVWLVFKEGSCSRHPTGVDPQLGGLSERAKKSLP